MNPQEELIQELLYALKTALLMFEAGVDPKKLSISQQDAFAFMRQVIEKSERKKS